MTADRKERERAVGILSTSFGEWYLCENQAASSNVAEGTENKLILMNCVEVWLISSSKLKSCTWTTNGPRTIPYRLEVQEHSR